jgi:hypothetical protein
LSFPYKAANGVGVLLRIACVPAMDLEEKTVFYFAIKQTGLTDFGLTEGEIRERY